MNGEREFGELKAKVDGLTEAFLDFRNEMRSSCMLVHEKMSARLDQHSIRIIAMEKWRWTVGAAFGGGMAVLAVVWTVFKFVVGAGR